jgi:hypothetical protein
MDGLGREAYVHNSVVPPCTPFVCVCVSACMCVCVCVCVLGAVFSAAAPFPQKGLATCGQMSQTVVADPHCASDSPHELFKGTDSLSFPPRSSGVKSRYLALPKFPR